MTDLPMQQSDVAIGLEDFEPEDMTMPILQIVHSDAVFEDKLSGVQYPELTNAVLLGLIKHRVLWPAQMGEKKEPPLCKSFDAKVGHTAEGFPWKESQFDGSQVQKVDDDDPNHYEAPCARCHLKEWGTHPTADKPWCSLQHTYAILVPDGDSFLPSILTIQRSGLKPSNSYVTSFARMQKPLFEVFTTIKLEARSRGGNQYAVPKFLRSGNTDPAEHAFYADTYLGIREFVRSPRGFDTATSEGGPDDTAQGPPTAPAASGPPPAAAPTAAPAPTPVADPTAPTSEAPTAPEAPAGPPADPVVTPAPAAGSTDLPF